MLDKIFCFEDKTPENTKLAAMYLHFAVALVKATPVGQKLDYALARLKQSMMWANLAFLEKALADEESMNEPPIIEGRQIRPGDIVRFPCGPVRFE